MAKQSNVEHRPGYRTPRTAAEQRFWDNFKPDFRKWALKKDLTLDEGAALAMGLDPSCLDFIPDEQKAYQRFLATKAWFSRNKKEFRGRITLEGICVIGADSGDDELSLPAEIDDTVDLKQIGFLTINQKVVRLERQVAKLKKENKALQGRLAKMIVSEPTKRRPVDGHNAESTSSKIIVALTAKCIGDEGEWRDQFNRIKRGDRSRIASRVKGAVEELGWTIQDETILTRFQDALKDWSPKPNRKPGFPNPE